MAVEKLEIPALLLTANDTISSWQAYSMRSKCSNGLAWADKKKKVVDKAVAVMTTNCYIYATII